MTTYLAQVTLKSGTGIPADNMVNTFHFTDLGLGQPDEARMGNLRDMLKNFYTVKAPSSTASIQTYMTAYAIGNSASLKVYNLGDPKPRSPVYDNGWVMAPASTFNPLPTEVALCCSWRAAPASGENPRRRRNRIYLSGFAADGVTATGRPKTALYEDIAGAAKEMKAAADASLAWSWKGWSPKDNENWDIAEIWVDNAWDTQRRRGWKASTRKTYMV